MEREGPPLEYLLRRLAETPADFLAEPRIGSSGALLVSPVVSDVLRELGNPPLSPKDAQVFGLAVAALDTSMDAKTHRNRLGIVLIACWLLHDEWFRKQSGLADATLAFLKQSARELASVTASPKFVSDPDRREELARLCLKDLGLRPAGETVAQAQDRLSTLSSVERQRVIRAARLAEERARAIRAEMARKAKAEADAKMWRE